MGCPSWIWCSKTNEEPHAPIVADHGFDPSLTLAHIFVGNGLHLQTTMSKEAMTKHQTKGTMTNGTTTNGIGDHAMDKGHAGPE
jgi:hypothetical protein